MNKSATITLSILIILTITSAVVSNLETKYVALAVLTLSAFKFLGIAFQFMEIKKAHVFWKIIIIGFVLLFGIGLWVTI